MRRPIDPRLSNFATALILLTVWVLAGCGSELIRVPRASPATRAHVAQWQAVKRQVRQAFARPYFIRESYGGHSLTARFDWFENDQQARTAYGTDPYLCEIWAYRTVSAAPVLIHQRSCTAPQYPLPVSGPAAAPAVAPTYTSYGPGCHEAGMPVPNYVVTDASGHVCRLKQRHLPFASQVLMSDRLYYCTVYGCQVIPRPTDRW